jgi:hypothetical protein
LVTAENQCPDGVDKGFDRRPQNLPLRRIIFRLGFVCPKHADGAREATSSGIAQGIVAVPAAALGKKGLEREIIPQEIGSVQR